MRRLLLALLVLAVLALFVASQLGPDATPRVERDSGGVDPVPATARRKPRVRTVQPKNAQAGVEVAPPDTPEAGPCSLFLMLSDEETGAPVASRVDVYRIDVPQNEYWTRGDRLQVRVAVPTQGLWIRDLPAALYRVVVYEARFDSEDSPAFGVRGGETRVDLPVSMSREYEGYLVVRTASGERVHGGEVRVAGFRLSSGHVRPKWLTPRLLRHPEMFQTVIRLGGGSGGRYGLRYKSSEETAEGNRLPPWRQDTKHRVASRSFGWGKQGWTGVFLTVEHDGQGHRYYTGISRLRQPIIELILLPDGGRAIDAGAQIAMASYPIEVVEGTPADAWRKCTTNVEVTLDGYKPLSFDLGLDEQPTAHTLVAAPRAK